MADEHETEPLDPTAESPLSMVERVIDAALPEINEDEPRVLIGWMIIGRFVLPDGSKPVSYIVPETMDVVDALGILQYVQTRVLECVPSSVDEYDDYEEA